MNNKDDIEIKLKKDQYIALVKLLYFADYCAYNGLVSEFQDPTLNNNLYDAIEAFYKPAIQMNGTSSFSLNSYSEEIPFTEDEALTRLKSIDSDLVQISNQIFATEFAKKDLNLPEKDYLFKHEGGWESKARLINEIKKPYLLEFNENGISNLRFKLFYRLPKYV